MAITTKRKAQLYTEGANIDANYGPWDSIADYESFITEDVGLDAPYDTTTICVKDPQTGVATKYIYENEQWRQEIPTVTPIDLTGIESRLDALEADKNAALVNQITSSVSVSPSRFYKGTTTTVSATGTIGLPSGIPTSKISAISITDGNGHTDSGSNKTSVSVSDISTNNTTITFTLTGAVDAPFTKSISKTASCSVCNPVYLKVVGNSVDTKEEAFTAAAVTANLVYTSSLPVTSMKGQSKSLTFTSGDRIAVVCSDSGLKARGNAMLADYNWVVNGESVTDNGITYNVYVSGPIGVAETRTVNFS